MQQKLEKEFPNSESWLRLYECCRQKFGSLFCKHDCIGLPARILNVQDITKERTKLKYISSTFIYSTTIAGAGQRPFDTCQWIVLRVSLRYTRCRPTHTIPVQCWASVAAHCWFNADKLSTTLVQHCSNTCILSGSTPANKCHLLQYRFNFGPTVFAAGPTLNQHWVIVPCLTFCSSCHQRSHYPDNTIHWYFFKCATTWPDLETSNVIWLYLTFS